MKIINVARKNDSNVIIELDNGDKLVLSYELLLKNGLKRETELSESHFLLLQQENEKFKITQEIYKILGRRIHSKSEIRLKLLKKKFGKEVIMEMLDEAETKGIINDNEFAALFIEEKGRTKKWGDKKLMMELMRRGVDREIIKRNLTLLLSEDDEKENAFVIGEKKYKILVKRESDSKKIRERLFSFLISKGYNYEIAKETANKLIKETAILT